MNKTNKTFTFLILSSLFLANMHAQEKHSELSEYKKAVRIAFKKAKCKAIDSAFIAGMLSAGVIANYYVVMDTMCEGKFDKILQKAFSKSFQISVVAGILTYVNTLEGCFDCTPLNEELPKLDHV